MSLPDWLVPSFDALRAIHERGRTATGLLLHGSPGCGTERLASRLAWWLVTGVDPDDDRPGGERAHPDLCWRAPEDKGDQLRIDTIREVETFVHRRSGDGHRCVVLDRAERMNRNAANALLKSLEEPAPGTTLILVTDAAGRLPATIRSRCQTVRVPAPTHAVAKAWVRARASAADDATVETALFTCADGPFRALSALEEGRVAALVAACGAIAALDAGRTGLNEAADGAQTAAPDLVDTWLRVGVATAGSRTVPAALQPLVMPVGRVGSAWAARLLEARRSLVGTGNPNVRLLVESLLIERRRLLAGV